MFVQLEYELSFEAPFHCGTGIREGLIDRTVIRDAQGLLYVPGSTLKGVLREQCEWVCEFYAVDGEKKRRVASPHDAGSVLTEFGGTPSLVTHVFGSQLAPCGLLFSDARLTHRARRDYRDGQTATLTQVRLDRVYRTAMDEALFTSQFGIPDLTFTGTIIGQLATAPLAELACEEIDDNEETFTLTPSPALLLLLAGLHLIERVGGNRSSGKGACRCEIKRLELDRRVCSVETWRLWLEQVEILSRYHTLEKGA